MLTKCTGFSKANAAANYFFWLLSLKQTIQGDDNEKTTALYDGCKSYEFDAVEFSYPQAPNNRVLKGVSLTVG